MYIVTDNFAKQDHGFVSTGTVHIFTDLNEAMNCKDGNAIITVHEDGQYSILYFRNRNICRFIYDPITHEYIENSLYKERFEWTKV